MGGSHRQRIGSVKVRLAPGANLIDVGNLNVFISYQTEHWRRANDLASQIRAIGFGVTIFPPQEIETRESEDVVRHRLYDALDEADIMVIVASSTAIRSRWVQFEVAQAAQMLGRVVFFTDQEVVGSPIDFFSEVQPNLVIKHSTILWDVREPDLQSRFAITLLYDRDEWWYEGESDFDPSLPKRLDLKREFQMRKTARKCVIVDRFYRARLVTDVLPFSWAEIGAAPGDAAGVLRWFCRTRGRLALEEAFINDEVEIGLTGYFVPGAPFLVKGDSEWLEVLVATKLRAA
jgi:hypothetical protein